MPIQCSYGPVLRTQFRSAIKLRRKRSTNWIDGRCVATAKLVGCWGLLVVLISSANRQPPSRQHPKARWGYFKTFQCSRHTHGTTADVRHREDHDHLLLIEYYFGFAVRSLAATSLRTRRSGHSFCFILYAIDAEFSRFSSLSRIKINCAAVAPIVHSFIILNFLWSSKRRASVKRPNYIKAKSNQEKGPTFNWINWSAGLLNDMP